MEDGQKITFGSEGDQEPGMEPGDIIIVLDEKEHPVFKRSGIDLIMQQNINITEALCGFKKTVPTLDDRTLVIQTVAGKYSTLQHRFCAVLSFEFVIAIHILNMILIFYFR